MSRLLLALCSAPLCAYQLVSLSTQPTIVHVGDHALVTAVIQLEEGERLDTAPTLPQSADLRLLSLDQQPLERRRVKVDIRLAPYRTGTIAIPPLPIGNLQLEQLSLEVTSLLADQTGGLVPELSPTLPPGLVASMGLRLLFLLLLLLLYLLAHRYYRPLLAKAQHRLGHIRDLLRLRRSLTRLAKQEQPPEQLCKQLSSALRGYLAARLLLPCLSYATGELKDSLGHGEEWLPLFAALDYCDQVRFARQPTNLKQFSLHLSQLTQLLPQLNHLEATREP